MSPSASTPDRPSGSEAAVIASTIDEADAPLRLRRLFTRIVSWRWIFLVFYALLLPPSIYFAVRVESDNSIDRLISKDDPEKVGIREFQKVFGAGEYAVLLIETPDPLAPEVLERLGRIESGLAEHPNIHGQSALGIFRRAKAGFSGTPEECKAFREFAEGTELLAKQGLVGKGFLTMPLLLDVHSQPERREAIDAIDKVIADAGGASPPITAVRKVGLPYVNEHLHQYTKDSAPRYFLLFGAFVVILTLYLYRSFRALFTFLVTMGTCVALTMGYIGAVGGILTIVSPMVPMTILVTATSSLVYLHSRFVACPLDRSVDEHRVFALANKFLAVTASVFATAVGFAALAVSRIHPIRQMGLWVALGMLVTWVVVFTLYPSLQKIFHAPTQQERKVAAPWFAKLVDWLIDKSYRLRWFMVGGFVLLGTLGVIALFGLPGYVKRMQVLTNPVEYIDGGSQLAADTKRAEELLPGLSISDIWLKGKLGMVSEPDVLIGLDAFQQELERDPDIGSAVGPSTILRMMRYLSGQGDKWPTDPEVVEELAGTLEGVLPTEPLLQGFVQKHSLAQAHISVVSHAVDHEGFEKLATRIRSHWEQTVGKHPALKPFELELVGLGSLQARVSQSLVPTLVESFWLTVAIIFGTFLLVFRSGAARLLAIIPSLFAISLMFGVMRLSGMTLNVATILIASTVLGTSENDQIHFFFHYQEKKRHEATVEQSLRHTLMVSGRAIFSATLINAGGFVAFALADLPPFRQFGILTAVAFLLSMLADFTALPAALWLVFRDRPDAKKKPPLAPPAPAEPADAKGAAAPANADGEATE